MSMIGVLKENTDPAGIDTFQKSFFPFPLYLDKEMKFYKELGNRKIYSQQWNFFKMFKSYSGLKKRLKMKGNIEGNFKGEGVVQGGVLLISTSDGVSAHTKGANGEHTSGESGRVEYVYVEKTGGEVPVRDIEEAILQSSTDHS